MIISKDERWFLKKLTLIPFCPLLIRSDVLYTTQNPPILLPEIPKDELHWMELLNRFNDRTVRRICRNLIDIEFDNLGHEVSALATVIRRDMLMGITDAELSWLFGYSSAWAQGTIAGYVHQLHSDSPLTRDRPRLVKSEKEEKLVKLCLRRQAEKRSEIVEDVVDLMWIPACGSRDFG
jgi:hypothetical protein